MRRGGLLAAVALLLLAGLSVALLGSGPGAEASSLSPAASGWLAARRYLEERGCQVGILDGPLGETEAGEVVVVTFPWQHLDAEAGTMTEALDRHLSRGGTLLLGVADQERAAGQAEVLEALGLEWREVRGRPPLAPWRWRRFVSAEWTLVGEGDAGGSLRMRAPRGLPRPPASGRVLYRNQDQVPVVFTFPRQEGQVLVLPAALLSNGLLGQAGNPDLLERLRVGFGDRWTFDELHHGLMATVSASGRRAQGFLSLILLQVALVYVLAVVALARRFGPPWSEPISIAGSTASFLVGLGALHHRLGHHPAAGRLLLERALSLGSRCEGDDFAGRAEDGGALVALGRKLAQAQAPQGGRR